MLAAIVAVSRCVEPEDFLRDMESSYRHKFANKPQVVQGNLDCLAEAMREVDGVNMSKRAAEINEQTPWQELTVGCEIYEGGHSPAHHDRRVALHDPAVGAEQMQAVPAVHPLLSRLLHPRGRRQAGRL